MKDTMNRDQHNALGRSILDQIDTLRGKQADVEIRLRQLESDVKTYITYSKPRNTIVENY